MSKTMPAQPAYLCWCGHPTELHIGGGSADGFCLGNKTGRPWLGPAGGCDCMLFLNDRKFDEIKVKRCDCLKDEERALAFEKRQLVLKFAKGRKAGASYK